MAEVRPPIMDLLRLCVGDEDHLDICLERLKPDAPFCDSFLDAGVALLEAVKPHFSATHLRVHGESLAVLETFSRRVLHLFDEVHPCVCEVFRR